MVLSRNPDHGGGTDEKDGVAVILRTINPQVLPQLVKHTYLSEVIPRHKASTGNGKGSSVLQPQSRTVTSSGPRRQERRPGAGPRARRTERAPPGGVGPTAAPPFSVMRGDPLLEAVVETCRV